MYQKLLDKAWEARESAYPWKSGTKVGCAIETQTGDIVEGWNMEGLWMTSLHAEVCAITKLKPTMGKGMQVAIVSKTTNFTPCGACIDWLMQFCVPEAIILIENKDRVVKQYSLDELMPHYPKQ